MSELIDRQALKNKICDCCEGKDEWCNGPCFEIMIIESMPAITASPWHRVEEELPNDGEWAIFTNGKVVSVERFKVDAYNHFFPASEWFDFEDAIAWMPLPEPPKEDADAIK